MNLHISLGATLLMLTGLVLATEPNETGSGTEPGTGSVSGSGSGFGQSSVNGPDQNSKGTQGARETDPNATGSGTEPGTGSVSGSGSGFGQSSVNGPDQNSKGTKAARENDEMMSKEMPHSAAQQEKVQMMHGGTMKGGSMDADHDGAISQKEFTSYQNKMFKEMDKDGNGILNAGEQRMLNRMMLGMVMETMDDGMKQAGATANDDGTMSGSMSKGAADEKSAANVSPSSSADASTNSQPGLPPQMVHYGVSTPAESATDQKDGSAGESSDAKGGLADAAITAKIKSKLAIKKDAPSIGIDVTTNSGIVTLDGTVESENEKVNVEKVVNETDGVQKVVNNLAVTASRQ